MFVQYFLPCLFSQSSYLSLVLPVGFQVHSGTTKSKLKDGENKLGKKFWSDLSRLNQIKKDRTLSIPALETQH